MPKRRKPARWTAPEKVTLDGTEYLVDERSLTHLSHETLTELGNRIAARIESMQSERDRLQAIVSQEQDDAFRLHEEYRRVLSECKAASVRMPKDKWGVFSGSFTSDELRRQFLGPYWDRLEEIAVESKHLEVWGRQRLFCLGHPRYLFFAEPDGESKQANDLGPRETWRDYRATTKTQRALTEHLKSEERLNAICARVYAAIQKTRREEVRETRRREAEHKINERKQRKRERLQELVAAAAATIEQTRKQADRLRSVLDDQQNCPYCDRRLDAKVHIDHIYPVSKGGRSVVRNLAKVCIECNLRKGNFTLAQFIKECGLDREAIEQRLSALGKDF
jgi:hypothetical protein